MGFHGGGVRIFRSRIRARDLLKQDFEGYFGILVDLEGF